MVGGEARYRFGPLERRGLIAGFRGGQVAAVGAGLVVGVGVVRADSSPPGVAIALGCIGAGLFVACWPIGGRTAEQWLPIVARCAVIRARGDSIQLSRVPSIGYLSSTGLLWSRSAPASELEGCGCAALEGCRVLQSPVAVGGIRLGIVKDARARTYTAVVALEGRTFALLEDHEKQRRLAAWAGVLAGLARESSAVHRVQWLERSLPDCGDALSEYLRDQRVLAVDSPQVRSYAELIERSAPVTQRHELMVALSVHAGRSARIIRTAGGGDEGACAVLARELASLEAQLASAEVAVVGALSPRVLVCALRRAVETKPNANAAGIRDDTGGRSGVGDEPATRWPWPMASEASWASFRADNTWHATYWIAEWPRVDVGPDFLAPLLLQSGARRTVSVTMEPISPLKAAREVERARTADAADAELRRRGGFMATARRRREEENVARRENELADGHAQYRFSGYVTVTAASYEALEESCGRVEQAAGQSRIELLRLYGEQDRAFTWTLPLGRGLA